MTLTLKVYEADNTTLVGEIEAGQWRDAAWGEANSQAMPSGPITLPNVLAGGVVNPALALIETGRVIRFLIDGTPRFAMLIGNHSVELVSPREEAGEITIVTGHSTLKALDKVCIRPDQGTGRYPWTNTRWFDGTADRLRDDDPDGPQGAWPFGVNQDPDYDGSNYFGRSEGYIDTSGQWVAGRDSRTLFAPGGTSYGRARFTASQDYDAVLVQFTADDSGTLSVDNVPTCRAEGQDGVYMGKCTQAVIPLSAGEHLVGVRWNNANALRTGFIAAIWSMANGMPDELLWRADAATMRILEYPDPPPGFTPTEVIRLVVDESQSLTPARLDNVSFSFISASDTRHAELTEVTDLAVKAPANTVLTLIEMLAASYLDIGVDHSKDGLRLDAWIRGTRGTDRSAYVVFEKGNCRRVAWDIGGSERATVGLVTGSNFAPFEWAHPDAALTGVYEEVALDFGDASRSSALKYTQEYLDLVSQGRKGVTIEILPTGEVETAVTQNGTNVTQDGTQVTVGASLAPRPYADFQIGDLITIPGEDGTPEAHRVEAIGASVGPDSVTRWEIDLDQPRKVLEERLDALIRRQLPASGGGRTILPARTEPSFPSQESGSEKTETWSTDQTGTVVLTKNGTAIPGASLSATGRKTLTDAARKYVKHSDTISFTVDGEDGFPEGWKPPTGRWLQEFEVTQGADGTTITVSYA